MRFHPLFDGSHCPQGHQVDFARPTNVTLTCDVCTYKYTETTQCVMCMPCDFSACSECVQRLSSSHRRTRPAVPRTSGTARATSASASRAVPSESRRRRRTTFDDDRRRQHRETERGERGGEEEDSDEDDDGRAWRKLRAYMRKHDLGAADVLVKLRLMGRKARGRDKTPRRSRSRSPGARTAEAEGEEGERRADAERGAAAGAAGAAAANAPAEEEADSDACSAGSA